MKTEDWNLLKRDLCARLPYGVIVQVPELFFYTTNVKLDAIFEVDDDFRFTKSFGYLIENVKPYLRPMSSMTEEEYEEYTKLRQNISDKLKDWKCADLIDWLNKHHFDYRGLIEKNLALDCTGLHIYD